METVQSKSPRSRLRTSALFASGVFAGATVFGGVALASHDADTIHACANNKSGALRMVESAADCGPEQKELPVAWNVEGPVGPQGPQGTQGEEGPEGPEGPQGPAGLSGYQIVEVSEDFTDAGGGAIANCPLGRAVLGGGYHSTGKLPFISKPHHFTSAKAAWVVSIAHGGPAGTVTVYAICAKVGS